MELDANGGVYLLTPREGKRNLAVTYVGFTGVSSLSHRAVPLWHACIPHSAPPPPVYHPALHLVSPKRRLKQHNGEIKQGAKRTLKYQPWDMCLFIRGFPSRKTALLFDEYDTAANTPNGNR